MPTHIFREVVAAHLRTATEAPMTPEVFAAYFGQWESERGHQLWLRNVRGFDEQDTADFEHLLDGMTTPTRIVWGEHEPLAAGRRQRRSRPGFPAQIASSSPRPGTSPRRISRALSLKRSPTSSCEVGHRAYPDEQLGLRHAGSMTLEGWSHVPEGYGAAFAVGKASWWLRIWFRTPFFDRYAYPMLVARGLGVLRPHPGLSAKTSAWWAQVGGSRPNREGTGQSSR
ncbi:MAG: hypothetical protein ACR2JG_14530 [Geodermatophilaceae bacterium]